MKYILLLLSLISLRSTGFGLGDWQYTAPGGTLMGDNGSGTYLYVKSEELSVINKWYFYKGHIVGELNKEYFILNEKESIVEIFKDKTMWTQTIHSKGLIPIVWTRWYDDNWVDGDSFLILLIVGFYFSIPFILFFLYALYRAINSEKFRPVKPYTIFVLTIVILIATTLLLDYYPDSF